MPTANRSLWSRLCTAPNILPSGAVGLSMGCLLLVALGEALAFQAGPNIVPRLKPSEAAETEAQAHLRVDTALALIPAHVTTNYGTPVTDLTKENFHIYEDGVEQNITYFTQEDAPVSVGLVFDVSGSMSNKMAKALEAATSLLSTANSQDEFFLVEFNDRPKLTVPMTPDTDDVYRRMQKTKPYGRTSLFDAVNLALEHMKRAHNSRKALVVLSDGGDNCSRHTFTQIRSILLESDVQVYAMGIFDPEDTPKRSREEVNGPQLLADLALESGGRHFPVNNLDDLPGIAKQIGLELRNQYLLGYSPSNEARDGKYRRVKLQLVHTERPAPLRVFYRTGYYALTK